MYYEYVSLQYLFQKIHISSFQLENVLRYYTLQAVYSVSSLDRVDHISAVMFGKGIHLVSLLFSDIY